MYTDHIVIALSLLTIALVGTIFLAAFLRLWRNPPRLVIEVGNVSVDMPIVIPDEFTLVSQNLPSKIETDKPDTIPIPEKILAYISLESDEWAQDVRKKRARALYRDSGDWNVVFRQLQKEDTPWDSTDIVRDDNV